jgi:hypothetical protein
MLKGNQMQTSIKLTAEQLALLLQVFDSAISQFQIEPSEQNLADEVLDILETAENKITSLY